MARSAMFLVALTLVTSLGSLGLAADATPGVTVLAGEKNLVIEQAAIDGGELLVPVDQVTAITGFELKPQGLCAGEVCIPMPASEAWVSERHGTKLFNASRFAKRVDQAFVADKELKVWSFTPVPRPETSPLLAGEASDFALQDRDGRTVRLSDFRVKKVLVLTWASWCACRFDLAGWQKVYEDLKDKNFEIVAAAQDTGGPKVVFPWYEKAHVTFTALADPHHTVSSLYQIINVPSGIWVDEQGKIVRPAEVSYSKQQKIMGQLIGDNRYAQGVRDWVEKGPSSAFVLPPEALSKKLQARPRDLRLADAHFKLGVYFFEHDLRDQAASHWQQSQKLNPDSWNYHRQEWSFDKSKEMANWLAKVRKLGDRPYYDPVEFPQAAAAEQPATAP